MSTVFVSFDWDHDRRYKFLLDAWNKNPRFKFVFEDATPRDERSHVGRWRPDHDHGWGVAAGVVHGRRVRSR